MNNLKQYAGLLNDEAPENHFLAYITPSERDMLVQAGGVKTPTASGIFAYPPGMGDPNYDGSGGGTYGGSGGNRDTGSDYGQFDRAVSQTSNNTSTEPKKVNNNTFRTRGRITDSSGNTIPSETKTNYVKNAKINALNTSEGSPMIDNPYKRKPSPQKRGTFKSGGKVKGCGKALRGFGKAMKGKR